MNLRSKDFYLRRYILSALVSYSVKGPLSRNLNELSDVLVETVNEAQSLHAHDDFMAKMRGIRR